MDLKKVVVKGIERGFPLIPLYKDKKPMVSWKEFSIPEVESLNKVEAVGMKMGKGLEAIDFDLKYDLTGDLYKRYIEQVKEYDPSIIDKMTIQTTVNMGFHWVYKCEGITDGNLKLARREANEQEKAIGEKVKVLIETRGDGGYIAIFPSEGYNMKQGHLSGLKTISREDRDFLISTAKSFNEYRVIEKTPAVGVVHDVSPLDDYDSKVTIQDTLALLEKHGFTQVGETSDKIKIKRAGNTKAAYSGYYEKEKRRFSVFSTSTVFEEAVRHKDSAVYAILEHNGDWNAAARELASLGFGKKADSEQKPQPDSLIKKEIKEDELAKYVVPYKDIWNEVEDAFDGKIEKGLRTGMEAVDYFFRFRKNALYSFLAKTNVGKTTIVQFLQVIGAVKHDLKWLVWSAENDDDEYAETVLGFLLGKSPKVVREENIELYNDAKLFIEEHFFFLNEANNLEDVLLVTKAFVKYRGIYALFIDPINSTSPKRHKEEWDYTEMVVAGKKMKDFTKKHCAIWISVHPRIGAQREKGIPASVDVEFGAIINKADYGIVLDRDKENFETRHTTSMKIDKVRAKRRGGETTPDGMFIEFYYNVFNFEMSAPRFEKNGTVTRIRYKDPFNPKQTVMERENLEMDILSKVKPPEPNNDISPDIFYTGTEYDNKEF